MAIVAISRKALPVAAFGSGRESKPAISFGDNGQIRFSTSLTKDVIGKSDKLYITWDAELRRLGFRPVLAAPKGVEEDSLFPISRGKDGESKQAYFGASSLLSCEEAGIKYDYKASGTQVIEPVVETNAKGIVTMYVTLPNSLTPRPKQTRAKKTPVAAPASKAPVLVDEDDVD